MTVYALNLFDVADRDEYLAYRPPGTCRSFSEIYNVQKLGPGGLDKSAQVVIAT